MSNGQNCAAFELFTDDSLDYFIVFQVNVGSCLINQDNFALFEKGSAYAKQLLFSY